jgi:hypothetical protein
VSESELRVLYLLRDHPWSTASQVTGLVNLPLRSVHRYLSNLLRAGLVQAVHVPQVRGSLYAPSADGIALLAGSKRKTKTYARAFHIDCLGLAETLLRAHSLTWARGFLTMLVVPGAKGLQWAVSPWEARSGRTILRLDACGCVLWMGRYVPFAVLADPGGLAVEGYARVFMNFAQWTRRADLARGVRPVLVMLTTYTRRALQLSVLWRDVTGRLESTHLDMFVAVSDELARNPAGWWRGGTAEQGPLWSGCHGSRVAIPRPWPSLAPCPGSRPVRVEDLAVWMRDGEHGWRRLVRGFLALSGKEWEVLEGVARWPLLRSVGLALLSGYSDCGAGVVAKALQNLEAQGLVEVVWESDATRSGLELQQAQVRGRLTKATEDGSREKVEQRLARIERALRDLPQKGYGERRYVISHLGLELLARTHAMPPLAYGRARLWPVGYEEIDGRRVVVLRIARYLLAYQHTLLINEFFLGLRRLAEEQWRQLHRNHQLLIWDSVECARWFWDDQGRQRLLPDAGGVYQIGQEVYEFWLEVDRGHSVGGKHGQALRRKYERYYLYRRRPDAIYGGSMPRLLIVTRQLGRARQVRQVIVDLARERGEPPLRAYVATLDDIWREPERLPDGTLRSQSGDDGGPGRPARKMMWPGLRAWRRVDDFSRLTWCFEGLGRMPPGTQRGLDLRALSRETQAHSRRSAAQRQRRLAEQQGETCNGSSLA